MTSDNPPLSFGSVIGSVQCTSIVACYFINARYYQHVYVQCKQHAAVISVKFNRLEFECCYINTSHCTALILCWLLWRCSCQGDGRLAATKMWKKKRKNGWFSRLFQHLQSTSWRGTLADNYG